MSVFVSVFVLVPVSVLVLVPVSPFFSFSIAASASVSFLTAPLSTFPCRDPDNLSKAARAFFTAASSFSVISEAFFNAFSFAVTSAMEAVSSRSAPE